jgi:hypothetical protein
MIIGLGESMFVVLILIFGTVVSWSAIAAPQSRLVLQNNNYVSHAQPYFRDSAEAFGGNAGVSVEGEWRFRKFHFQLQGEDQYSATERWNYLNVHELAATYQISNRQAVVLGRRLADWNEWETDWHQGVFQPRYMLNKLRSEPAGLTGLFLEGGHRSFQMTAGLLANVPDLGAHFYVRDNQFYSANPWFKPPADAFIYNSNRQEIRYSVDKPSAGEVIAKPGFATKTEYRRGAHLVRVSYAYKPMPQLLLGFPSRNQVVIGKDDDYMRVRIQPRVVYHRLVNLDYVVKSSAWTWSTSLAHENPVSDSVPDDFTAQQVGPAWISTIKIERMLEEEGPQAARISLGWLKVNGGDRPDRGELASAETLFERRYQFTDAVMVSLRKPIRKALRFPIETEARVIFDRLQNGGVLSLSAGHQLSRATRIAMEADFLGLLDREAAVKDGFLAVYRANDRLGLEVSYVF